MEEIEAIESELEEEYTKMNIKAENKAIERLKKNPKYFYNYAMKKLKSSNLIGPFLEKDGNIVQDSFEKAEKLRNQYESVFSKPVEKRQILDPDGFFRIFDQHQHEQDHDENHDHDYQEHHDQEDQECTECGLEKVHIQTPRYWHILGTK